MSDDKTIDRAIFRTLAARDYRLMEHDTATPLESGRVAALADRCEVEGLGNCATTLRGLLQEVATLHRALREIANMDAGSASWRAEDAINGDDCQTTPPEDAIKRAISVLNVEVSRLHEKAARWEMTSDAVARHVHVMREDAAEVAAVRAWLEQFVTRDPDGVPQ